MLEIKRSTTGIPCPKCNGYSERVNCTAEEIKKYGCSRDSIGGECCARAFVCKVCGHREAMKAPAPEME